MQSPLCNIDIENFEVFICNFVKWFNTQTVEAQSLFVSSTNCIYSNKLKEIHKNWDQQSEKIDSTDYSENELYQKAPTDAHAVESLLDYKKSVVTRTINDSDVILSKPFHFTINASREPIGFIRGSCFVNSKVELPNEVHYNIGTINFGLNIDFIELAPEYRGRGVGSSVLPLVLQEYVNFMDCVLSQFDEDVLNNLSFNATVESELSSQSGARWIEHLYNKIDAATSETLLNFGADIDNIGSTELEASL